MTAAPDTRPTGSNSLTEAQIRFFDTFGFITLPGVIQPDLDWIVEEFEQTFVDEGVEHDGTHRSAIVPFLDARERMCGLIDHPVIQSVMEQLAGPNANYIGSDGNYYTGNTNWHSDGRHAVGKYLKIAIYLDHVTRDSGALRVIPGSHRIDMLDRWDAREAARSAELWNIDGSEVPCVVLESEPGDLVVFNHNIMHSSWGGSRKRRMFTANICRHASTEAEIEELKAYISHLAIYQHDTVHRELMLSTAGPSRMRHLRQVIDNASHLPALAARQRAEGPIRIFD